MMFENPHFKPDEASLAEARSQLALLFERGESASIALPGGQPLDMESAIKRRAWISRSKERLANAPTHEAFGEAIDLSIAERNAQFDPDASADSRAFFEASDSNLRRIRGFLANAPLGDPFLWKKALQEADAPLYGKIAKAGAVLANARSLALAAAESLLDPLAYSKKLAARQSALAERFGFASFSTEGLGRGYLEETMALRRLEAEFASAAKELGIAERQLGFNGKFHLRRIESAIAGGLQRTAAYMTTSASAPALGIPAGRGTDAQARSSIRHEWAHMLDFELGMKLWEIAWEAGDELPEHVRREILRGNKFFSCMSPEAQKLIPQAFEGYAAIMGAAMGVQGHEGFESLRQERSSLLDSTARQAVLAASGGPSQAVDLPVADYEALMDSALGAMKFLLTRPETQALGLFADDPRHPSREKTLRQQWSCAAPDSPIDRALNCLAAAYESAFGKSWREQPDGSEPDPRFLIAKAIEELAASPMLTQLRRIALLEGSQGAVLNPDNAFAAGSRTVSFDPGLSGYADSPHEMFARVIGRSGDLFARSPEVRQAVAYPTMFVSPEDRKRTQSHNQAASAWTPSLDAQAQAAVAKGWSMMAEAAGLGPAKLAKTLSDSAEAILATKLGTAALRGLGHLGKIGEVATAGADVALSLSKRLANPRPSAAFGEQPASAPSGELAASLPREEPDLRSRLSARRSEAAQAKAAAPSSPRAAQAL